MLSLSSMFNIFHYHILNNKYIIICDNNINNINNNNNIKDKKNDFNIIYNINWEKKGKKESKKKKES